MSQKEPPLSRGERTKKAILDAALNLFAINGYSATGVREIANTLGVKQSALYNHFKGKEEILDALITNLVNSQITKIFDAYKEDNAHKQGKMMLFSIATTFKLTSFDPQNEALFKLLMQEIFNNIKIREIYNEFYYQENIKKLSSYLFMMMQDGMIQSSDPLLLANEFLSPLFFYQMQIILLKIDKKPTSSMVSYFEKHVEFFWENIKLEKKDTLF